MCELADINRSTFYKYYDSQYDLLNQMEKELVSKIEEECTNSSNVLLELLQFIKKNKEKCKLLFSTNTNYNFLQNIFSLPILDELLSKNTDVNCNYAKTFIFYGGYYLILEWINNDCKETPDSIVALLNALIK